MIYLKAWLLKKRGASLGSLVVLGDVELLGKKCNLSVGERSFIGTGSHIALHNRVSIGARVVINNNVTLLTASHRLDDPMWSMYSAPIIVEDYAWLATGCTVLPGVKIGRGAVVGAGAVVRSDVPEFAIVTGNPAVEMSKRRCSDLTYSPVDLSAPFEAWIGKPKSDGR